MSPEKPVGAALLLAGGVLCGCTIRRELRRRAALLADLAEWLGYLEAEISLRLTPLPELLDPDRGAETIRPFLADLRRCFDESASFPEAWRAALAGLTLAADARDALDELGNTLGRYDAVCQADALRLTRGRLLTAAENARQEAQTRGALALRLLPALSGVLALLLW